MLAIFSKELRSYFISATGYIFMGIFLLLSGIFFALSNLLQANSQYSGVLESMVFVFLILVPVLTMRIISEETKQKTDQLLFTSPQSLTGIILGKYFAAVALFLITLAVTLLYPLILSMFGKIAIGEIISNYVGFALLGASFISIGLFISALTDNQVVAAVGTFGALLILWILDSIQQGLPTTSKAGIAFAVILVLIVAAVIYFAMRNIIVTAGTALIGMAVVLIMAITKGTIFDGFIAKFFGWVSLLKRYETFSMGILNVTSIVYFVTFSFIFVFLTVRMIEKRRWS